MSTHRLRRLVQNASKHEDCIIMLDLELTRIGRHSQNEYHLDSTINDCLISRFHAEIHRTEADSRTRYIVRDRSLNGTYINNIRVSVSQELVEGDVLTFGHVGGHCIMPGARVSALQQAEFQFIFEHIEATNHNTQSNAPHLQSHQAAVSMPCRNLAHEYAAETVPNVAQSVPVRQSSVVTQTDNDVTFVFTKTVLSQTPNTSTSNASIDTSGHASLDTSASKRRKAFTPRRCSALSADLAMPYNDTSNSASHGKPRSSQGQNGGVLLMRSKPPSKTGSPLTAPSRAIHKPSTKRHKQSENLRVTSQAATDKKQRITEMFHSDNDLCAAFDCQKPIATSIFWVQCDDCDAWYHTACAGCMYDINKLQHTEFHCGCL